jgi:hypothetical protein
MSCSGALRRRRMRIAMNATRPRIKSKPTIAPTMPPINAAELSSDACAPVIASTLDDPSSRAGDTVVVVVSVVDADCVCVDMLIAFAPAPPPLTALGCEDTDMFVCDECVCVVVLDVGGRPLVGGVGAVDFVVVVAVVVVAAAVVRLIVVAVAVVAVALVVGFGVGFRVVSGGRAVPTVTAGVKGGVDVDVDVVVCGTVTKQVRLLQVQFTCVLPQSKQLSSISSCNSLNDEPRDQRGKPQLFRMIVPITKL